MNQMKLRVLDWNLEMCCWKYVIGPQDRHELSGMQAPPSPFPHKAGWTFLRSCCCVKVLELPQSRRAPEQQCRAMS